jgi:hypothetical protein
MFTLFMILAFEATTAFSRQKNMETLRGMSSKAFSLLAFRNGSWGATPILQHCSSALPVSTAPQPHFASGALLRLGELD